MKPKNDGKVTDNRIGGVSSNKDDWPSI